MGIRHRWNFESVVDALHETEHARLNVPIAGRMNIGLVFPGPYALGMSNLGYQTVHRLIGSVSGIGVERFFFPIVAGQPHPPPFYSFETRRPLGDFDILAFSISYEGDFDRLPDILGPLGIPMLAEKRGRRHPLLMAGGAAIGANAAAVSRIFDVLIPGEAETTLPQVLQQFVQHGIDVAAVADLPGVWVPRLRVQASENPPPYDINILPAYSHVITPENVFQGASLIEIMRGCPRACAFCLARVLYHPCRRLSPDRFEACLDTLIEGDRIGLVAPSLFDHPELVQVLRTLATRRMRLHNSSVKWEKLTDEVLALLLGCGVKSLTLAPETGSSRLAARMGKPLPHDRFFATVDRCVEQGIERLKLYFLIGAPEETEDDIDQTLSFIHACAERIAGRAHGLSVSFSGFVPKRRTVWENQPVCEAGRLKKVLQKVRRNLAGLAPFVKFHAETPGQVMRQAYLARVGPELAEELEMEAKTWEARGKRSTGADLDTDFS